MWRIKFSHIKNYIFLFLTITFISCDFYSKDDEGTLLYENLIEKEKKYWDVLHSSLWIPIKKSCCPRMFLGDKMYSGKIAKYHKNSKNIEFRGQYKDGLGVGVWNYYSEEGSLIKKINKDNGNINTYYDNEILKSELINNSDFVDTLSYKEYYINGQLKLIKEYSNDQEYSSGKYKTIIVEEKYFDDKGVLTEYYNNDSIYFKKSSKNYLFIEKGYFTNSKKDSLWETYYNNGNLKSKGKYRKAIKEGYWEEYYENKSPKCFSSYIDGKLVGGYKEFYENGQLKKEGKYILNIGEDGLWKEYFIDGKVKKISNFKMGYLDGPYKEYSSEGKLLISGKYKAQVKIGYWYYYDEKGKLIEKIKEDKNYQEIL